MAIWQEYLENAYICCVHYIVNKKLHWSERIFWLFIIMTSLGGTYYVVSRTWFGFKEQEPLFKVDTDYLDWNAPFPSVIICENMFLTIQSKQKKAVDRYLEFSQYNKSVMSNVNDDWRLILSKFAFMGVGDASSQKSICNNTVLLPCPRGNYSFLVEQLRQTCTNIFNYCKYNDKVFDCCEEFLPTATANGKCFAFNNFSGRKSDGKYVKRLKWYITRKPGESQGMLYLEIKWGSIKIYTVSPTAVSNQENEEGMLKVSRINMKEEFYNGYRIEETITFDDQQSLSTEARGCRFLYENNLKYFDVYTEVNCLLECFMMAQKEMCGCILHTFPAAPSEHCELESFSCIAKVPRNTACHCLPDCNSTKVENVGTFNYEVDSFITPGTLFSVRVDVPAPTLRYVRYSLKTQLSCIVAIGGAIGFLLGFSFLTIAQVIYYFLIRCVTDYFNGKKKRKGKDKEDKMEESFRIARMSLKLEKVEKDIHRAMLEKMQKSATSY